MNRLENYYYYYLSRLWKHYWNRCSRKSRINGIILMFHHVCEEKYDNIDPSCVHSIAEFRAPLERLRKEGYRFVDIAEALRIIDSRSETRFAAVTFDDVFSDVYSNAYPILKEMGIPFTCFITTGFIDKPGYLTESQIKEMDKDPLCTIGAHTVSHPMLRHVPDSPEEIKNSKKTLEQILGHDIRYLAYPFGQPSSVSRKIMRIARNAGFDCAFGTIDSPVSDTSSRCRYYLPRMVIRQ